MAFCHCTHPGLVTGKVMVTILAVGQDPGLLYSRAAVLRQSKADVRTANFGDAIQTLTDQRFDLVVLCHTLSAKQMIEVERAAHELQNGVLVLKVVPDILPRQQDDTVDVDDVSLSNPESLVDKVVRLLHLTEVTSQVPTI
jgi:CheY-like chemotaxis protein